MTYRHKRDPCIKNTKDIIDNILRERTDEYDLAETSQKGYSSKSREVILIENEANVLISDVEEDYANLSEMENYKPCQEFNFEVTEVKDVFEKKKKRRNYIEFREDCVKTN